MSEKIIGHFYLKKTSNGNLLGEFTNETTDGIFTESADLQDAMDNSFSGVYLTSWREDIDSYIYELTISIKKKKSIHSKYYLSWRKLDTENATFIGEGFLVNDLLIGHYRSF